MSQHTPRASFRLILSTVVGVGLALVTPHSWPWEARMLLGWVGFCSVNLLRLSRFLNLDGHQTKKFATREDETRVIATTLTTLAALFSLVGVLFTLHQAAQEKGLIAYLLTGLAVLTVALSWLLIQSEYTLHYARRFYMSGGGVQFMQKDSKDPLPDPNMLDFAYLSFTIGMTFQVSDMLLDTHKMRRLLLGHALLSYFFSAVIIAVMISAVANVAG